MVLEFAACLFDSDGVLVDSHALVEAAWRQLAEERGLDADLLVASCVGVRSADLLRHHVPAHELVEVVERFEEIEVGMAARATALPGARRLLESLDTQHWAVVTSGSRRLAEVRWKAAGLPAPASSVTADDVARGKPDPEPYLRAADLLGVDPRSCVVFEDSPSGAVSAHLAGAAVVAVGEQSWDVEPIGRIPDLAAVTATADGGRRVQLSLGGAAGRDTIGSSPRRAAD